MYVSPGPHGRIAVAYYVFRADGDVARAQFAVDVSEDQGRTFSAPVRARDTSLARAPKVQAATAGRGASLGDDVGLASAGKRFVALYSLPADDPADVFFASVGG